MSVIPRLIKTAIFHDSPEFRLSRVRWQGVLPQRERERERERERDTHRRSAYITRDVYDAPKNGMRLLSRGEMIAV